MKPGRKPLPPAEVVDANVNHEAVARAGAAATELVLHDERVAEQLHELSLRLQYQGPLQPDLLEQGIRIEQSRAIDACLNVGKMLLLLKEQCAHGEFTERVARLGIEASVARRFMQSSLKFASASPKLLQAIGNQSKLFELLILDDEDIQELSDGGTVHGITVDKIGSMGVIEMRNKLRDQDATLKAKDKVIEGKSKKIDALEEQLHRRASSEPAEREAAQLELLRGDCLAAETALLRALSTIDTVMQEPATEAAELAARHSVDFLVQKLVDACLSRGITVDLAERVSPIWTEPIKAMVAKGRAEGEAKAAARRVKAP